MKLELMNGNKAPEERRLLLQPISRLYTLPEFTVDRATSDSTLIRVFYELAIKLTKELPISPKSFAYYRDNYIPSSLRDGIHNEAQLIDYLGWEMEKPARNDGRYRMGFRSIYYILDQNIDQIKVAYICEINKKLAPFYKVYRYPALLIPSCVFGE